MEVFQIERIAVLLFGPVGSLGASLQFPVSFLCGAGHRVMDNRVGSICPCIFFIILHDLTLRNSSSLKNDQTPVIYFPSFITIILFHILYLESAVMGRTN